MRLDATNVGDFGLGCKMELSGWSGGTSIEAYYDFGLFGPPLAS